MAVFKGEGWITGEGGLRWRTKRQENTFDPSESERVSSSVLKPQRAPDPIVLKRVEPVKDNSEVTMASESPRVVGESSVQAVATAIPGERTTPIKKRKKVIDKPEPPKQEEDAASGEETVEMQTPLPDTAPDLLAGQLVRVNDIVDFLKERHVRKVAVYWGDVERVVPVDNIVGPIREAQKWIESLIREEGAQLSSNERSKPWFQIFETSDGTLRTEIVYRVSKQDRDLAWQIQDPTRVLSGNYIAIEPIVEEVKVNGASNGVSVKEQRKRAVSTKQDELDKQRFFDGQRKAHASTREAQAVIVSNGNLEKITDVAKVCIREEVTSYLDWRANDVSTKESVSELEALMIAHDELLHSIEANKPKYAPQSLTIWGLNFNRSADNWPFMKQVDHIFDTQADTILTAETLQRAQKIAEKQIQALRTEGLQKTLIPLLADRIPALKRKGWMDRVRVHVPFAAKAPKFSINQFPNAALLFVGQPASTVTEELARLRALQETLKDEMPTYLDVNEARENAIDQLKQIEGSLFRFAVMHQTFGATPVRAEDFAIIKEIEIPDSVTGKTIKVLSSSSSGREKVEKIKADTENIIRLSKSNTEKQAAHALQELIRKMNEYVDDISPEWDVQVTVDDIKIACTLLKVDPVNEPLYTGDAENQTVAILAIQIAEARALQQLEVIRGKMRVITAAVWQDLAANGVMQQDIEKQSDDLIIELTNQTVQAAIDCNESVRALQRDINNQLIAHHVTNTGIEWEEKPKEDDKKKKKKKKNSDRIEKILEEIQDILEDDEKGDITIPDVPSSGAVSTVFGQSFSNLNLDQLAALASRRNTVETQAVSTVPEVVMNEVIRQVPELIKGHTITNYDELVACFDERRSYSSLGTIAYNLAFNGHAEEAYELLIRRQAQIKDKYSSPSEDYTRRQRFEFYSQEKFPQKLRDLAKTIFAEPKK